MKIGVDIDGTINNFQETVTPLIEQYFNIKLDMSEYCLFPNISKEDIKVFFEKYGQEIHDKLIIDPNILEVFNRLTLFGEHEVIFLTARPYYMGTMTIEWLRKNRISYKDILFNCSNKADAVKYTNVSLMIEDSPKQINNLIEQHIPYIIIDHLYNKDINDGLLRTNDWNEISKFLVNFPVRY